MNPELETKIEDVYRLSRETWERLSDYFWNVWFVLEHEDMCLESWKVTRQEIDTIKDEFTVVVKWVLEASAQDIILRLKQNKPDWTWTNKNMDSIKKAFIH